MPTDVAVGKDGRVYVADGVNDRVLSFDAAAERQPEEIRNVGAESLSRPLAVTSDAQGRLWIADTGNARVVIRAADGSLYRVLAPNAPGAHPVDITDVLPEPDGKSAWLADNDNHRLIRLDLESGAVSVYGGLGESLGQLHYPFMLALGRDGQVLATDVINGRVARFSASGAAMPSIGSYGVDLGQLYRPKGVAVDADGSVWVSDGTLGVIQVFDVDGRPIDVLRDSEGKPLRLDSPMGLDFDPSGDLYVAELTADRARQFHISRRSGSPPAKGGPGGVLGAREGDPLSKHPPNPPFAGGEKPRPAAQIVGAPARNCTACHIEWIEPFSKGQSTTIATPPPTSEEEPAVSRSGTCLSCHDGSVADSRQRVWQAHGHRTGVKPPEGMKVPAHLPLVAGQVACRTCHSAHAGGQFTADFRGGVMLRVSNQAGELCVGCHQDKTRGPKMGTHPTGGMPWPVPQSLIDAGARVGPNPRELTCQVCHLPHGSAFDHLLVKGTASNQLCLTCHDQMRPGMFREGSHIEHPFSPVVNAAQAAAVQEMGTRLGPEGRLICLSCHRLHHGKGERFMLADELTDGRFCIRCHEEKTTVLNTSHDLRQRFPDERNRLGMTPQSGGPCSACHLFHRYARAPEVSTLDPGGGKCVTCHQQGRCAEGRVLGAINHPKAQCVDCHNPHSLRQPHYLREAPAALCSSCHQQQATLIGGPHDLPGGTSGSPPAKGGLGGVLGVREGDPLSKHPPNPPLAGGAFGAARRAAPWPAEALATQDACLSCHRPHGNEDTGLFRLAGASGGPDAGCRACHQDSLWTATGGQAAVHPQCMPDDRSNGDLPLASGEPGSPALMACRTCHDPHGGAAASALLSVAQDHPTSDVCAECHAEARHVEWTGHGAHSLVQAGLQATACRPCHAVHADPATIRPKLLSPSNPQTLEPLNPSSQFCVACHRQDGPARPPMVATHPAIAVPMSELTGAGERMPLFDEHGHPAASGQIGCLTCHLPHGRQPPPDTGDPADLSDARRRSMRLMLRPFDPPNLCTTCHGADGLRRFLYFHDPARRAGPLESPLKSP